MDATEMGAYFSLLIACYQSENKIPSDDTRLARMARVSPKVWKRIKPIILDKFIEKDGFLSNMGAQRELQRCGLLSTKNKANALKRYDTDLPVVMPDACQTPANTSNKEQVTKNKEVSKKEVNPLLGVAVESYNLMAEQNKLPQIQKLSASRKTKLTARMKDCDGIEGWNEAMKLVSASPFLLGDNNRGWKADFDFIVTESKFIKIMEGGFSNKKVTRIDNIKTQIEEINQNGW